MRKYWAFFTGNIQNVLTYRGPMIIWLLSSIVSVITIVVVWESSSGGKTFGGFTKSELISYYIVAMAVQWLTSWWPFYWVKDEIKDGSIVNRLTKPVSLLGMTLSAEAGWHTISSPLGLVAVALVSLFFKQFLFFPTNQTTILFFILSIVLSIFITCTLSLCMALVAFWFTHIYVLDSIFWSMTFLIGGRGLPFSFLSGAVLQVAFILPFRYMLSFPLEVYFQKLSSFELIVGFGMQIAWCLVLFLLYKQMLNRGVKAYTAFGN